MQTLAEISLAGIDTAGPARKKAVAAEIGAALASLGFFVVADHGVPPTLIDETIATANRFFDLPAEEKRRIRSTAQGSPRGFIEFGVETLGLTSGQTAAPDLKEGFGMGPPEGDRGTQNVWPAQPAGFRDAIGRYYRAMEGLTGRLMQLFAIGMDLPEDYFVQRFARHNSTLRLINYPPQHAAPEPGQLRAGPHTDYGALTILLGQDKPGGLQVRTPGGDWIDARTGPHSFVINIGDLMMRWSNDTWLSNMHRVSNPPPGAVPERRLSLAYFCNPDDDLLVECLPTCTGAGRPAKYGPIRAGQHRFEKIETSKGKAA